MKEGTGKRDVICKMNGILVTREYSEIDDIEH